ncbi:hypothetical protein FFLO_05196 [Filobasidium floriforme]|uniref:Uncharacterized protein n=1 Tax=Filobasidium floriforme TaxID=5210 RepID=A0A8K0JHF5_9TREE|nr:uncharacterized protein HD553DRAFT_325255 [Filobasidium floriforme]KAG7530203.1 hypothetical protein FFLO_05196 [Filobasidium floriforme]KAH8081779.1 hypothetical protein HD553DRAFT_325255 [Filobasidium floriforme]
MPNSAASLVPNGSTTTPTTQTGGSDAATYYSVANLSHSIFTSLVIGSLELSDVQLVFEEILRNRTKVDYDGSYLTEFLVKWAQPNSAETAMRLIEEFYTDTIGEAWREVAQQDFRKAVRGNPQAVTMVYPDDVLINVLKVFAKLEETYHELRVTEGKAIWVGWRQHARFRHARSRDLARYWSTKEYEMWTYNVLAPTSGQDSQDS